MILSFCSWYFLLMFLSFCACKWWCHILYWISHTPLMFMLVGSVEVKRLRSIKAEFTWGNCIFQVQYDVTFLNVCSHYYFIGTTVPVCYYSLLSLIVSLQLPYFHSGLLKWRGLDHKVNVKWIRSNWICWLNILLVQGFCLIFNHRVLFETRWSVMNYKNALYPYLVIICTPISWNYCQYRDSDSMHNAGRRSCLCICARNFIFWTIYAKILHIL